MAICRPLCRTELLVDTVDLARFLLGKIVARHLPEGIASGRIVETEAYVVGDAASHAFRGMTPRTRSLFREPGIAYVYVAYGISSLLNVSSELPGIGASVLIRALEPLDGIPILQRNRGTERVTDLMRGPGRLTAALRIDRALDGIDLCREGPLYLARDDQDTGKIAESIRIGISRETDRRLRFYRPGNPFVSGPRWLNQGIVGKHSMPRKTY